jgi:hypothetical protein
LRGHNIPRPVKRLCIQTQEIVSVFYLPPVPGCAYYTDR